MNPATRYLLSICTLLGRLSHAVSSSDSHAFLGTLHLIRKLTDEAIVTHTPPAVKAFIPFRVVDDTPVGFYDIDDDEL